MVFELTYPTFQFCNAASVYNILWSLRVRSCEKCIIQSARSHDRLGFGPGQWFIGCYPLILNLLKMEPETGLEYNTVLVCHWHLRCLGLSFDRKYQI